jgi:hypothetical protein
MPGEIATNLPSKLGNLEGFWALSSAEKLDEERALGF